MRSSEIVGVLEIWWCDVKKSVEAHDELSGGIGGSHQQRQCNAMQCNSGARKRKWKSDLHSVQVPPTMQQIILNAVFCQSMSFWDSVPGIRLICCLFGQILVYNDICRTYPSTKKALSLNCHDRRSASLMSVVSSHKWKSLRRICNPSHPSSIIILLIIAMVIMVRGVLTQQAFPRQFWNDIGDSPFLVKKKYSRLKSNAWCCNGSNHQSPESLFQFFGDLCVF